MKKFYNLLFVLAIPGIFLVFTSGILYHTGSPGGKTGSPGDGGANCSECHTSTPINTEFWIYSPELLTSGYASGQTYNVFVVGFDENAVRFGFEATAEDANGNKVGTFEAGFGGFNQTINNSSAITHTVLGITPVADTGTVWFFSWTAPNTSTGQVTLYAAINAANGNNGTSGDQIYLSQFVTTPQVGTIENVRNDKFGMYPNPSTGVVKINRAEDNTTEVQVMNINGQLVLTETLVGSEDLLDLNNLEKGVYFVRIENTTQRIILH